MRPWFLVVTVGAVLAACSSFSGSTSDAPPSDGGVSDALAPSTDSGSDSASPGDTPDGGPDATTDAGGDGAPPLGCVLGGKCVPMQTCCEHADRSVTCVSVPSACMGFTVSCWSDDDCKTQSGTHCLATVGGQRCESTGSANGNAPLACSTTSNCGGGDAGTCDVVSCPNGHTYRTCGGICPMN